ncbi:MAG: DUF4129 domain-containing protein [Chloroflexi bacterium]|nr:DUF4129 domain-containing protein [Chloroflexota bacterium]
MTPAPSRSGLPWAVMGMEAALLYPLTASWLAGPDQHTPLGPLAALSMLPLGFWILDFGFWIRTEPNPKSKIQNPKSLWLGVAASLGLRLLVSPLPAEPFSLAVGLQWLGSALVPAGVGFALWWRGGALAEAEFSAADVRTEFTAIGAALLALLGLFGQLALADPLSRGFPVVLFLCSGLAAVGLARQEAAGASRSASAGLLVAGTVLLVLVASLALVALLSPEVVAAILAAAQTAMLAVVQLLLLPLMLLGSWLHLELPRQEVQSAPAPIRLPQPAQVPVLPAWLEQLLAVSITVLVVLAVVLAAAMLLWLLLPLLQRAWLRAGLRAPAAVEREGGLWRDADALLVALRGWLARLAGGALQAVQLSAGEYLVHDARAAYRVFLRWARRQGLERAPSETPQEFLQRLVLNMPEGQTHYIRLTEAYELARYGGVAATESELARLRQSLGDLSKLARPAGANADREAA